MVKIIGSHDENTDISILVDRGRIIAEAAGPNLARDSTESHMIEGTNINVIKSDGKVQLFAPVKQADLEYTMNRIKTFYHLLIMQIAVNDSQSFDEFLAKATYYTDEML